MHTIAIDCGASFIKGALFQDGTILSRLERDAPYIHNGDDIRNATQIQNLISIVKDMILELGAGLSEARLCISNEMHGFLLAFKDGSPCTDYISWQIELGNLPISGRGGVESAFDVLGSKSLENEIRHTGMQLRSSLPSCNLLYLLRNGTLDMGYDDLYFYTLGDYILKVLLDEEPYCHPSNAAATGLFDIENNTWNPILLETVCGNWNVHFPTVGTKMIVGMIEQLKVYALPALGDQQAALYGSGLKSETAISFNLGTGSQVSMLIHDVDYSDTWQVRPYFNGFYIKTIPHIPSGRALNVYFRFFKQFLSEFMIELDDDQLWGKLLEMESSAIDSGIECDLSFFQNPVSPNTTGSISLIREDSFTAGNLMRAVFMQMARNFIIAADRICMNDTVIRQIIFSGGVARKIPRIRQLILEHYSSLRPLSIKIAENETLTGLYLYGESAFHNNEFGGI